MTGALPITGENSLSLNELSSIPITSDILMIDIHSAGGEVPRDCYWWKTEVHDRVYEAYAQRRTQQGQPPVDEQTLIVDYCEGLPLDDYGKANVYAHLIRRLGIEEC